MRYLPHEIPDLRQSHRQTAIASLQFSKAALLQIAEVCAPEKASELREHLEMVKQGAEQQICRAWGLINTDDGPNSDEESQ